MKSFIRWLAAAEIHDARMAGYRDAVGDCADVIRAQAAYLSHNQAWVDYLNRGSEEAVTLFGDDNRIEPTWVNAQSAVAAGLPLPTLPLLRSTYDELFVDEDEPADDGSSGITA